MPFSLFNTLASFQGYINRFLAKKLDVFIIVYLDNILIFINKVDDTNSGQLILEQMRKYFLYDNLKKCKFHSNKIQVLSYVISL